MEFGDTLKKSWKEFRDNSSVILKLFLIFVALPALIIYVIGLASFFASGSFLGLDALFRDSTLNLDAKTAIIDTTFDNSISDGMYITIIVLSILSLIFSIFFQIAITAGGLKGKKFNYNELTKFSWGVLIPCILFILVLVIFIIGLTALLIIPGIMFFVYWIFASFAFIDERKGIISALKRSYHLVRGRWWITFGRLLLLLLVVILISIIFSIPSLLFLGLSVYLLYLSKLSLAWYLTFEMLGMIVELASSFVTTTLAILFVKNMYLSYKKEKR